MYQLSPVPFFRNESRKAERQAAGGCRMGILRETSSYTSLECSCHELLSQSLCPLLS